MQISSLTARAFDDLQPGTIFLGHLADRANFYGIKLAVDQKADFALLNPVTLGDGTTSDLRTFSKSVLRSRPVIELTNATFHIDDLRSLTLDAHEVGSIVLCGDGINYLVVEHNDPHYSFASTAFLNLSTFTVHRSLEYSTAVFHLWALKSAGEFDYETLMERAPQALRT